MGSRNETGVIMAKLNNPANKAQMIFLFFNKPGGIIGNGWINSQTTNNTHNTKPTIMQAIP